MEKSDFLAGKFNLIDELRKGVSSADLAAASRVIEEFCAMALTAEALSARAAALGVTIDHDMPLEQCLREIAEFKAARGITD